MTEKPMKYPSRIRRAFLLLSLPFFAACAKQSSLADAGRADLTTVQDFATSDLADPGRPLPALPLYTDSRWILDANGQRFKLAAVNWYGAEEQDYVVAGLDIAALSDLARLIAQLGYNAVRIPWSNEMYEQNPVIADAVLSKNPALHGLRALNVLDAVVTALAHQGLLVILDNHMSDADWCCSDSDENGLWWNSRYSETAWLSDWQGLIQRYQNQPAVVGADLRNELRASSGQTPTWGGADPTLDWKRASAACASALLNLNSHLLIIVEGLNYSTDFTGVYSNPLVLGTQGRLVYSPHDYAWFHNGLMSYSDLKTALGNMWGFLLVQGMPFTAPVWVGEFGTCHTAADCVDSASGQGFWFAGIREYLSEADIDWAYWPLNGTEARGQGRTYGAEETYGVLDVTWQKPALPSLQAALAALQPATQHP
jgi:endoglucanase